MATPTDLPIYGNPEACQKFNERHPFWDEMMVNLVAALNFAFTRIEPRPLMADKFVYFFGRQVYEDFFEITLICQHGYGIAASKLLRSMYEQTVTLCYLHHHPEEAQTFLNYHAIQRDKLATRLMEDFDPSLLDPEVLKEVRESAAQVKENFMVPVCDHPGAKMRLNHSWNKLDFVSMAKTTDVAKLINVAYFIPLLHAHPTFGGLVQTLQNKDGIITINPEAQFTIADHSLVAAHNCLLATVNVQGEHFHIEGLDDALELCKQDFLRVWTRP
jgi:Family of unknown function (DUF5677)